MFRTDMNEMNIQPIDLGDEPRECIQFRLDLAPVVVGCPIAREGVNRRELHALRCIRDVAFMRLRNSVSSDSRNFHMKKLTDCVTCARCVRLNASAMTALQGGASFHLLLPISNNVTLYRTPKWASRRRKMPDLLLHVKLRLTNGQCRLWVMYGRCPRCKRNLTISEAFGCGHVFGL